MIEARILADSTAPNGARMLTFLCTYPRFILAEVNTHRVLSRNSASSRAIPVGKMLGRILEEPARPIYWGENQKGMQAGKELSGMKRWLAEKLWVASCYSQVGLSWAMSKLGVHKQVANRLVEPFSHMTTIISGTEWGNFFNLRAHPAAQPEFQEMAYCMLEAYVGSTPRELKEGEWHVPFSDRMPDGLDMATMLKIATARCARLSYLTFDGQFSIESDCRIHDQLLANGHMSPFEHCAMARPAWDGNWSGNVRGFTQYRKTLANENRIAFDPYALLAWRKK